VEAVRGLRPDHPAYDAVLNCFERALVTMHKMPRIWEMLLGLLHSLKLVTRARRCCDRALCSLPITQHTRVWNHYLSLVRQPYVPAQTALQVYRRYLQLEPGHAEEYIEFLKARGHWNEAAIKLADLVNDDR
jgi:pre-mRNA-splicing factor SYF1